MSKSKKNKSEWVVVKVEGCFTEWYSPYYQEPYETNEEYADYYDSVIAEKMPVIGPSLGDADDEYIGGDLDCLTDRLACDAEDWHEAKHEIMKMIRASLEQGVTYDCEGVYCGNIKITPYRKEELPPVNEASLAVYGPYAELMRQTVAAI